MSYKLTKEGNVDGLGEVSYVFAPVDKEMNLFKQEGLKLITARDLAFARIQTGKRSSFSTNGSWIKEGVLYFPKEKNKIVLVRTSEILRRPVKGPIEATKAHRQGKEFFLTEKAANEYLERVKANRDSIHVLKSTEIIPTNRFGEDETTVWLFRDQAQKYGEFLKDSRINTIPLYFNSSRHIKSQGKPYANQLWLGWLGNCSYLNGINRFLYYYLRARGVKLTAEGGRAKEKVIEAYTPNQITTVLKKLKLSGLENQIIEALKGKK